MKRTLLAALAGFLAVAAPLPSMGQIPSLTLLNQLDSGLWELKTRGDDVPVRRVCLGDARKLIQLRHPRMDCRSFVVSDSPVDITVQYTCPGQGYGRTNIRRETNQLIQLDTQGIAQGAPFAFSAEGRRVGPCKR